MINKEIYIEPTERIRNQFKYWFFKHVCRIASLIEDDRKTEQNLNIILYIIIAKERDTNEIEWYNIAELIYLIII